MANRRQDTGRMKKKNMKNLFLGGTTQIEEKDHTDRQDTRLRAHGSTRKRGLSEKKILEGTAARLNTWNRK